MTGSGFTVIGRERKRGRETVEYRKREEKVRDRQKRMTQKRETNGIRHDLSNSERESKKEYVSERERGKKTRIDARTKSAWG